ncbi:winged helix-turn-helix transcriptional regulator [Mycobacterium celatum]|uniref:Transcriptional regulator n=1 Tax=Mycobacterium celatum TaxID=28045 RepID=A0A1X1RWL2_MYCCE|nr:helix-turn-helix domain-containing protein [Mycobacterium celatum]ORV19088.1 transcriptional regulator [Mycobacterium celatum]PIB78304.1 transcriptional regulator [Mycobacterium celatum]
MLDRDYPDQVCSIARALEVIGQRWSVLIVRDVFLGRHRFDDLCAGTGITRSMLAARLAHLVDEGVLERRRYQSRPERFEYHLTEKGRALLPVLTQLMLWGDRYYGEPGGPPLTLEHHDCGGHPQDGLQCDRCGAALTVDDVRARPAGFARRP